MGAVVLACSRLGAAGLLSAIALSQSQPQLFTGRCEHVGLLYPQSLVIKDFDGDGDLDLAVGAEGDGVAVLLGDGAGGLAAPQTFAPGRPAFDLEAGDLDGNGDLDLALVGPGTSSEFFVLWGDGAGGFSGPAKFPSGGRSRSLDLVDMDGDGRLDVVLANPGFVPTFIEYSVSVVLSDAAGGFLAPVVHQLGWGLEKVRPFDLVATDLDADGDADLVAGGWNGLAVLLNDGQAGVARQLRIDVTSTEIEGLAWGDLDSDGVLDVVAAGRSWPGSRIDVYLGSGNGNLQLATSRWTEGRLLDVALADLDADGLLDVCATDPEDEQVVVLYGDGQGGLGEERSWPAAMPEGLALGDLDGDGHADLVATGYSHHVVIWPGDGLGGFRGAGSVPAPETGWLAAGDMNEDGFVDLVATSEVRPRVLVFPGEPGGSFGDAVYSRVSFLVRSHAVAEMTGDGHLDVVANDSASGELVLLEGDGDGHLTEVGRWPAGTWPNRFVLVDVDRDAALDVAVANQFSDSLELWRGDGQGGLTWAGTWAVGPDPTSVAAGDLDRDGDPDLALTYGGGDSVGILLGDGLGGFAIGVSHPCDNWPNQVVVADVDADADLDLVTANDDGLGSVSVLLGDGLGGFSAATNLPAREHPKAVAVADVSGDGVVDLVVGTDHSTPELAVLVGDGSGGFGPALLFGADGGGASTLVLADFDRDGRVDVAVPGIALFTSLLPDPPACTDQVAYCAAKLNSAGCLPRICSSGSPTLTGPDDFVVTAERVVGRQLGLFVWGLAPAAMPLAGGTLCVAAPIQRTPVQFSGGAPGAHDCSGTYAFHLSQAYMLAHGLAPGVQVFGQYWSRDAYLLPPFASGLTDALRVTIEP